jgi:hypothetical protein
MNALKKIIYTLEGYDENPFEVVGAALMADGNWLLSVKSHGENYELYQMADRLHGYHSSGFDIESARKVNDIWEITLVIVDRPE